MFIPMGWRDYIRAIFDDTPLAAVLVIVVATAFVLTARQVWGLL